MTMEYLNSANSTNSSQPLGFAMFSKTEEIIYMTIYGTITVVAILGNVMVIITISYNKSMRNVMYTLLLSLSVSDFIFAMMSPFHVRFTISPGQWDLAPLGDAGCKIYYFLFRTSYSFSVLTLIVITIDRYLVISFPLTRPQFPPKRWILSALIVASMAFTTPMLIAVQISVFPDGTMGCTTSNWVNINFKAYFITIFAVLFFLPAILMITMYSKMWKILRRPVPGSSSNEITCAQRRRTALMLTFVVFGFLFSWTPWCLLEGWLVYVYPQNPSQKIMVAMNYSMLPVYASTAINPLLYCLFSAEFRRCAIDIVFYHRCRKYRRSRTENRMRETKSSTSK